MERKLQRLTERFDSVFLFNTKVLGSWKSKVLNGIKFAARKNFFEIKESLGEMVKRAGEVGISVEKKIHSRGLGRRYVLG